MGRREVAAARGMVSSPRGRRSSPRGSGSTARDLSQLLWVGPVSEIEAYCHIFRAAEQLHAASRRHSVIQLQGECPVRYDVQAVNLPVLEAKVTAVLGWMLALRNQGQKEVLSGLSGVASAFQGSEDSTMERIPPLTLFRGKRCCESMRVALANYLVPSEAQWLDIWRMLQRLKMPDMIQVSQGLMVIPVQRYFQIGFRGGQFSGVQLEWLLSKGFKIIVNLWEEDVKDDLYLSAVQEAVSLGKIEVVQRFTEVVSDSVKKPIYLHCQEGNGRTSVMVSRWKQCWATQNGSLNGNDQLTNSPGFSSEGSKNSTSFTDHLRTKQSLSAEQNEPLTIKQLRFYGLEKLGHPSIVIIFYQLLLVLLMENHPAMEPPHLLRKGKSKLQGQQLILGHLMPAILKAILSLDHKNLLKGTIVKYLLACMPLPSTFFLDGREQSLFKAYNMKFSMYEKIIISRPKKRSIQMSHVCCLLQSARTHCHLDLSSFLISARLELKIPDDARSNIWVSFDGKTRQQLSRDLSKAINLVQTRRNLVENDRVLLNPAHRAQQEYERTEKCSSRGSDVLRIANLLGVCKQVGSSFHFQNGKVDEWHEQPAAIGVDWVTIDGQIVGAWINLLGQQAHVHVLKEGFRFDSGPESDVFVGNSLVDMYLKTGSISDGAKVFERMAARDNVSWNAMIVGYAQNGRAKDALLLFERMLCSNERPDSVTMIGVLSACGHSGLVKEGRRYFQSMTEDHGIIPTRDHYTCMIDLLGRAGHLKEVEELIENMPMEPDAVLWASLLGACRLHKNIDMGEWAAGKLFELDPDNSGPYVLLSNMYAELGKWADVFRVRRSMKHRGVSKQPGCSWIEIGRKVNVFLARDNIHPCRNEIHDTLRIIQMQMSRMSIDAEIADDLMNFSSEAYDVYYLKNKKDDGKDT
uniref:DSP-PTPase phosphatase fused to NAD+ Kinase domain-containing protein n=1 Tax=Oryza rufipogon TaxID=4529 RepID=A0A0E0P9G0_ORYRU